MSLCIYVHKDTFITIYMRKIDNRKINGLPHCPSIYWNPFFPAVKFIDHS